MTKERKEQLLKMNGKEFFRETGTALKNNKITLTQYNQMWRWWEKNRILGNKEKLDATINMFKKYD